MRSIKDRLLDRVSGTLHVHGFALDPSEKIFKRRQGKLLQNISLPFDVRGEMDVIVVTANLSVRLDERRPALPASRSEDAGPPPSATRLLSSVPRKKNKIQVLTCNIGYLMAGRQWQEWEIDSSSSIQRLAVDLVQTIIQYGVPWLESFDDEYAVEERVKRGDLHGLSRVQRASVHLSF